MKQHLLLLVFVGILFVAGCIPEPPEPIKDDCKDVPKLTAQKFSSEQVVDQAVKIGAAAEMDAAKLGGTELGAKAESSFSRVVKDITKRESNVSDEFWEQEITYRRAICYLDSLSRRSDLTEDQKTKIIEELIKLNTLSGEYDQAKKKKIGSCRISKISITAPEDRQHILINQSFPKAVIYGLISYRCQDTGPDIQHGLPLFVEQNDIILKCESRNEPTAAKPKYVPRVELVAEPSEEGANKARYNFFMTDVGMGDPDKVVAANNVPFEGMSFPMVVTAYSAKTGRALASSKPVTLIRTLKDPRPED